MMSEQKANSKSSDSNSSFAIKRSILGVVGLGCLIVWVVYLVQNVGANGWNTFFEVLNSLFDNGADVPALIAITGRIGLFLTVLWFALPSLQPLLKHASVFVIGFLLITVLVLATRPRLVPFVIGAVIVCATINWVIKSIARAAKANEE